MKFEPYFLYHVNCLTLINGVPVHVDIRWISYEECHLILFDMFSTFLFHMDYWYTYLRVYLVDIKWSLCLFFTCNSRSISHVDYWCTFSGVFHVSCFTWINGVPVHVNIRWISCEECHLILFHIFSTCIFYMDYWYTYPHVYLVDIMWCLSLDFLLMCIPRGFFLCTYPCVLHVILFPWINGEPGTSLGQHWFNVVCLLVLPRLVPEQLNTCQKWPLC